MTTPVNLSNLFRPDPPQCPANSEVGAEQWLRIYVPTLTTCLTMGHHYLVREGAGHGSGSGGHGSGSGGHGGAHPVGHATKSGGSGPAQFFSVGDGFAEAPHNDSHGAKQHLRIYVPTENTQLNMGAAYPKYHHHEGFSLYTDAHFLSSAMSAQAPHEQPQDEIKKPKEKKHHEGEHPHPTALHPYTGFSVTTEGHIVVSVGGRMSIESRSHVVIQSIDSSCYLGAPGALMVGSMHGTYLASPGGVIVHGGGVSGVQPPVADSRNADATPDPPDAANGANDLFDIIGRTIAGFDAFMAGAIVIKGGIAAKNEIKSNNTVTEAAVVAGLGALRDSFWTAIAVGGAGVLPTDPFGGTVVYGDKSVVCTTALLGLTSLFAGAGFMVGSPVSVFIGAGVQAEMLGAVNASLESNNLVSVGSDGEVEVIAKKQLEVSAREGDLRLDAKEVSLGGGSNGHEKQAATDTVVLSAKTVGLQSKDKLHLAGEKLVSAAGERVTVAGEADTVLASGQEAVMSVKATEIWASKKKHTLGINGKSHAVPKAPAIGDGWSKAGKDFREYDEAPQKSYAEKLVKHVQKVKGFGSTDTQIMCKSGKLELQVNKKFTAVCDGSKLAINRNKVEIMK